ncbi:MAG: LuxR C-terminal-related transcriptional regulator [Spirochaetia bacterium]|jgi:DNA-binding CsgD family transcriptional regulator|nr:LuxR C-terminal-related transcriptional regulator [Spirochaetia bacterium]
MQHLLIAFYILFFATGFMGSAAILLLKMRIRSTLLTPLFVFQLLFLFGTGLIIILFYLQNLPSELYDPAARIIIFLATATNTSIWTIVIILIKRISPPESHLKGFPALAAALAVLVIAKSIANMILVLTVQSGSAGVEALTGIRAWNLSGHILTGLAMASFGILARGPLNSGEPSAIRPLMKAYGLCAIIFAPAGLMESAIQASGIGWLSMLSLDHLFYLAWNIISMTAAVRLLKPSKSGEMLLETVPEERIRSMKLSEREVEMAVMIGQGLTNKEIAAQLFISPATVRTHIYNLYQKTGAGSRIELLNMLRS